MSKVSENPFEIVLVPGAYPQRPPELPTSVKAQRPEELIFIVGGLDRLEPNGSDSVRRILSTLIFLVSTGLIAVGLVRLKVVEALAAGGITCAITVRAEKAAAAAKIGE